MAWLTVADLDIGMNGTWPALICALPLFLLPACSKAPSSAADPPSTDRTAAVAQDGTDAPSASPRAAASPPATSSAKDGWSKQLGQVITVTGAARNLKLGALVETAGGDLWVDGLGGWPDELSNRPVRVTGKLIERNDLPVFEAKSATEPQASGMPVPPGTDLEQARKRYLLTEASWQAAQ
ncbi:MAG: hypothetical protein JRI68_15110 [Deltaproteobacteria bacterium]|nr:hypothetical protein [Deltaproteobacteria bacterium]